MICDTHGVTHANSINASIIGESNRGLVKPQVLGYTAEEYIGQPIMNFCPDEQELVLEIFKTCISPLPFCPASSCSSLPPSCNPPFPMAISSKKKASRRIARLNGPAFFFGTRFFNFDHISCACSQWAVETPSQTCLCDSAPSRGRSGISS